jgi:membrane dipeptidase
MIMYYRLIFLFVIAAILNSCGSSKETITEDAMMVKANELAQKYIITDGHVDLPYRLRVQNFRLEKEFIGIPIKTDKGDFDWVRSRQGGLDAPFMSIYIPSSYQVDGGAKELADSLINMVEYIAKEKSEYFGIAKSPDDVIKLKKDNKIALPMGMENGAPVENDISLVRYFKDRGISYITLTHAKDNKICDSSYDTTRTHGGLSDYGYQVIRQMQQVGIMIDISHVSDSTFYQVVRNVQVPVIASHSSARKFTPGFERNMADDMIRKMKDNGGVIMVNFGSTFLDGEIAKVRDKQREEVMELLQNADATYGTPAADKIIEDYQKNNPSLFSDVEKVADHIDHIVALAGVDHVGFGSDYDGVGDSLPTGLKDVSDYPNLIKVLLDRGYSDDDIEKICSGNLFRVWNAVLTHARSTVKTRG